MASPDALVRADVRALRGAVGMRRESLPLCGFSVSSGASNQRFDPKQSGNAAPTSPELSLLASFGSDVSDEKVTLKTRAGNVCLALCVSPFGFKGKTFYVGIVGKSWNGY